MSCSIANSDCKGEVVDCPHCGNHKVCKEHLYTFQMLDEYVNMISEGGHRVEYTNAQWIYCVIHKYGVIDIHGNIVNYDVFGIGWFYAQYKYMLICKNATEIRNEQERVNMILSKSVINNGLVKTSVNGNFEKSLVPLVYSFIE